MTPVRARFTLLAIMALFLATAGNALFLQEHPRLLSPDGISTTAISIMQFPAPSPPAATEGAAANPPQVATAGGADRVGLALQRELAQRGYFEQLQIPGEGLRLAVLAYEFDNAMPLTGQPDETLLKRVLFDLNQAPRGVFADRAEANPRLVMEVQKVLLGLGFFSGVLSGRMDVWTTNAVKDFQRHRGVEPDGRLTEATLLGLVSYSGQPLQLPAG